MSELLETPLTARHREHGGRMVPFAGYAMPVQYTSIVEEHRAVRERVGLFDVSHMGQLHLRGPDAAANVERLVTCPVASLRPGRIRYGVLCNEGGGVVDDVTVYREAKDDLFLCVNAANIDKDREWVAANLEGDVALEDRSTETGMIALQGPTSEALLASLCDLDLAALRRFRFQRGAVAGVPALISRTGYTGSAGFELYLPAAGTVAVFDALLAKGDAHGLQLAGLGARDTLRLEAALPLYGHELDDDTSPLEARLDRFVKLDAGGFIGAEAVRARREAGHPRLLTGFVLEDRGIARAAYPLLADGAEVGVVTSGAPSPTLGKSIGLGYVPPPLAEPGTALAVRVRGRALAARVVETPFV